MEEKQFKNFLENKIQNKNLDLKHLSEISGIALNNLQDLIDENTNNLPPAPYVRGYLIKLGKILDFNGEEWWEYFKNKKDLKSSGKGDELPQNRFISFRFKKYILIVLAIILTLIYFIIRFNNIFGRPVIELNIPSYILNVTDKNFVINGEVKNVDKLFINLEEVFIDKNGKFSKEIILQPGINNIEIKAQKLLRPETKILRQIFYQENQNSFTTTTNTNIINTNFIHY